MNTVVEDIVTYLSDSGFGEIGTSLFGYELGLSLNQQIVVLSEGSMPSELKESFEYPLFQLIFRAAKGESSKNISKKEQEIRTFLLTRKDVTINGEVYQEFWHESGPYPFGRDENDCYVLSTNYSTIRNLF